MEDYRRPDAKDVDQLSAITSWRRRCTSRSVRQESRPPRNKNEVVISSAVHRRSRAAGAISSEEPACNESDQVHDAYQ